MEGRGGDSPHQPGAAHRKRVRGKGAGAACGGTKAPEVAGNPPYCIWEALSGGWDGMGLEVGDG